jgi:hypothetical protein
MFQFVENLETPALQAKYSQKYRVSTMIGVNDWLSFTLFWFHQHPHPIRRHGM